MASHVKICKEKARKWHEANSKGKKRKAAPETNEKIIKKTTMKEHNDVYIKKMRNEGEC